MSGGCGGGHPASRLLHLQPGGFSGQLTARREGSRDGVNVLTCGLTAQADQRVLKDFLVEKLPRLAAHFDLHAIDVSLVTFNWFLSVFVESLPSDILLPLWDAFLYEGSKVQRSPGSRGMRSAIG